MRDYIINGKKCKTKWESVKMQKDLAENAKAYSEKIENPDYDNAIALAEYRRKQADLIFTWEKGLPELAFFESEDFEYGALDDAFFSLYPHLRQGRNG